MHLPISTVKEGEILLLLFLYRTRYRAATVSPMYVQLTCKILTGAWRRLREQRSSIIIAHQREANVSSNPHSMY